MSDPTNCPICSAPSLYDFSGRDLMFGHHERHDYHQCSECGCVHMHPG